MDFELCTGTGPLYIDVDGRPVPGHCWDALHPTAIFPGAFNPVHPGHRGLAAVASELLRLPVAFELSLTNVDKPPLSSADARQRLGKIIGHAPVWLTQAPRFLQKAALFPGAVFVVGADTALRIVDPRYYDGATDQMHEALMSIERYGCRFLVACRVDGAGRCIELADVPIPVPLRRLFDAIPAERFRLDVCSTVLRARGVS